MSHDPVQETTAAPTSSEVPTPETAASSVTFGRMAPGVFVTDIERSVAFYTDRDDLKSCRTKFSQELVEALIKQERSIVLFTHAIRLKRGTSLA